MEITKEFLAEHRANYIQQRTQMLTNVAALEGAIQTVDVMIVKLEEKPPEPTT